MSPWLIHEAQLDDAPEIAAIIREVAPLAFEGSGTPEQLNQWIDWHARESTVLAHLVAADTTTVVAEDENGRLVGTAHLRVYSDGGSLVGYVGGLYCRVRGLGVGPAIIRALAKTAESAGASRLSLSVAAENARMLHTVGRLGFEEESRYLDEEFFTEDAFVILSAGLPLPT